MFTVLRLGMSAAMLLSLSAAVPAAADTTRHADEGCPIVVDEVIAYQQPGASVLTGEVRIPGQPLLYRGSMTRVDGSQTVPVVLLGHFELPLGTNAGEWYVSHLATETATGTCSTGYEPVAPYLLKLKKYTRITATAPPDYTSVPYGEWITATGILEGWTQATGWQPLPFQRVDIMRATADPPPVTVRTDAEGQYRTRIRAYGSFAAGLPRYAGDDTWIPDDGFVIVGVHSRITARVDDTTPAVGQRVRVTGRVAPGNTPVRLEELRGDVWTTVAGPVTADASGHYVLHYRPTAAGQIHMRAWTDGTNIPGELDGVYPNYREFTLTSG